MSKNYFTLIELIVVIAIIAILAAIIAPNAFRAIEKSRIAKTKADLDSIKTGIAALYADTGKFPNGCPAFSTQNPEVYLDNSQAGLVDKPSVGVTPHSGGNCEWTQGAVDSWDGPYLDSPGVKDFWHTSYFYDPDYRFCHSVGGEGNARDVCNQDSPAYQECEEICPGSVCSPPVIVSAGQDKSFYTCDDIPVKMTLN